MIRLLLLLLLLLGVLLRLALSSIALLVLRLLLLLLLLMWSLPLPLLPPCQLVKACTAFSGCCTAKGTNDRTVPASSSVKNVS
jgi:hypothetical protein